MLTRRRRDEIPRRRERNGNGGKGEGYGNREGMGILFVEWGWVGSGSDMVLVVEGRGPLGMTGKQEGGLMARAG